MGRAEVESVKAEFAACCAGELNAFAGSTLVPGGAAVYCGSHTDLDHWNVSYVRHDQAVVPLAVGKREQVVRAYDRLDKTTRVWDPVNFPVPKVIVGGNAYHFAHVPGRVLLGLVRLERRAVLLAAMGAEIAVLYGAGQDWSVLHVGPPNSLRELDVDRLLTLQGRTTSAVRRDPLAPIRPAATIQAEYRRIIHGVAVDAGPGLTVGQVLVACFEDLADRAEALRAEAGCRLRGKSWVRYVVRRLARLAQLGVGDLVGRVGQIIARIQQHCSDFTITSEAMSDVLALLVATGTCIMDPHDEGDRVWKINLARLDDPRSRLHRLLCRETKGRHPEVAAGGVADVGIGGAARTAAGGAARPPAPPPPVAADLGLVRDDLRTEVEAGVVADVGVGGARTAAGTAGSGPSATTPPGADEQNAVAAAVAVPDEPTPAAASPDPSAVSDREENRLVDDEIDAAIAMLSELPPEAAEKLRIAARLSRGRRQQQQPPSEPVRDDGGRTAWPRQHARVTRKTREPADEANASRDLVSPAPGVPWKLHARPWRRRQLHLSPDHTLTSPRIAIVATAAPDADPPSHARTPRRARRAGDVLQRGVSLGTLGPRGPPASTT